MIPKANQIYRHFKGNLYRIITIAEHTETAEAMVVYQALYDDYKVYTRPLSMFIEKVDEKKYPQVKQKLRFEPVTELIEPVIGKGDESKQFATEKKLENSANAEEKKEVLSVPKEENTDSSSMRTKETVELDPLLEAYLDTDSCRERLNVLRGLRHRITDHMLTIMAVVIDFDLPEGSLEVKYDALQDCLLTREKYECRRMG